MQPRTMVKAACVSDCITFRTVSREGKSPRELYVFRSLFDDLADRGYAVTYDGLSCAEFCLDRMKNVVSIRFLWLARRGDGYLSGRDETVMLSYKKLAAFVKASAQADGPKEWQARSMTSRRRQPKLVFCDEKPLRDCLSRKEVRRKLVRFLRDNFHWIGSDEIRFYCDFIPYSFFFQEIRDGKPSLAGGLILHGQEDMQRAYYSIHT